VPPGGWPPPFPPAPHPAGTPVGVPVGTPVGDGRTGFGPPPVFSEPGPTAAPSLTLAGGAQLLAVVLTGLGLSIPFTDANYWSTSLAWALFAMAAALLQLAPLFGRNSTSSARRIWTVGAAGTAGLVGFWVLIALPGVSSNQGFVLTRAAAAAVAGCWLSPGRPR
jgi:hypothetical protein